LQGLGEHHPDRLGGLADLSVAYHALGKTEDRDRVARDALEGLEQINGSEHPIAIRIRADMKRWSEE
jgi:hypothetical protein